MITEQVGFQSSVNIRFDLGKQALYERYLPTPSHVEPFLGLLKGFFGAGSHAHVVVGPYGSGKSLLATLVADMMVSGTECKWLNILEKKFLTVDGDIYNCFDRVRNSDVKYIPVVMSGSGSGRSFRQIILSSMFRTLKEQGIDLAIPLVVTEIKRIVSTWESEYRSTFADFLRLLSESNWNYHTWIGDVENYDVQAIEWFKTIYPSLTSGSQLRLSYDHDLVSQIMHVLEELRASGCGLFFVYDEFGRYLQTLKSSEVHAVMQDLQDFAELANHHGAKNLNVLLITHRNFGQYALRFSEELHKEFQRIEKRYSVYYTQADRATFIRLASSVTEQYRRSTLLGERFVSELRKYNLFPELTYQEVDALVIQGSFPLHPVSLFAIPQLANLVGQNERTLFTFLQSDEKGGLSAHVKNSGEWYLLDQIFDYFEPSFSEFEKDSLIGETYRLYSRLQRKLLSSDLVEDELRALKVVTLWRMASLNSRQVLVNELLAFALLWEPDYAYSVLESLQNKKVIRYNLINGYWDLFEGSSIDIDAEIGFRQDKKNLDKRQQAEILEGNLSEHYILPKHYNDEKSMTRFASVHPVFASEVLSGDASYSSMRQLKDADATVILVIEDLGDPKYVIDTLLERSKDEPQVIIGFPQLKPETDLKDLASKLSVVDDLLLDKYFLSQDQHIEYELNQLKQQFKYELNQMIDYLFDNDECLWIHHGDSVRTSRRHLGQYVSQVMRELFPLTPEIRNESFNRRKITKVQYNAAVKVVDLILNADREEDLHINGFGPDYLIFATVVKNNGISLFSDEPTENEMISELKERLLELVSLGKGSLQDLIAIFKTSPFGIRKPVIPILLAALLKGEWKQLMFYNNLIFTPEITGEMLYYMVENPENYTFTFQRLAPRHKEVVKTVEFHFSDCMEESDYLLQPSVLVSRTLLRWLRQLPKITQSTIKTSVRANELKDIIRKSEVEPVDSLEALYRLLKRNKQSDLLCQLRVECEEYCDKHEKLLEEKIYGQAGVSTFDELREWALSQDSKVRLKNPLIKGVLESAEATLLDVLSESIVGVKRENWADATDDLFMNQVQAYLQQLSNGSYESFVEVKIGDSIHALPDVSLSDKSKAIYNNTKTNLRLMGRTVPKEEMQVVLIKLLQEFLVD